MAVPEQTPYIEHIANGVTTSFALEFECKDKEHLIVLVDNVELNVGTWSLVNGAVVFGIAPANGKIIAIQRNTPFQRDTNFQSYDNSLRPATINKDLDWIWYKLQELGVADWILGNRIDALKNYVDDRDDELRAYLLEEIRKQGVALDQLDEYYNYLMQRLAQIAVDKGWDASFVVDGDQNQKQINAAIRNKIARYPTIMDFFTSSELVAFNLNPNMDCTSIIKRAFATGVKKLNFLDLQMHITISSTVDDPLAIFEDGDIEIFGNGAAFIDNTVYNTTVASFNPLFILNGDVSSFKSNVAHIGLQIPDMDTQIGYRGATYVYSKRENKNIHLYARLKNTRYGILAGSYSDPSLGGADRIRFDLDCKNVGYPIATYLADDIEGEIRGDGFHRVHYIAGCNHARIKTQTKNYYIAPIAHYYTDAKTGDGTSRACTDCKTEAKDQGSTQYVANGYLMGFGLSRVDPNTVFDDIELNGHIRAKNGVAEKLGLATVVSSVRTVQPSYPTNWSNAIELNNITIKGIIDRRAQTTEEHGFSDLYLACVDDLSIPGELHFPKIKNLNIDVDYFSGSGNKPRGFWWFLNGLQDVANVRLNAKSSGLNVVKSNPNSLIKFRDSAIIGVDVGNSASLNSKMEFIDSDIYGGNTYLPPTNKRFSNTKVGGAYPDTGVLIKTLTNELTLTGASVTWASALPIHAMILGVTFVITQEIVGSSGLLIGDGTTVSKFINSPLTTLGAGIGLSNVPANTFPYVTPGTRNIVVTARDSGGGTAATFTGGKVKIVVNFIEIPIPS